MAIRQSPEDFFGQITQVHEQAAPETVYPTDRWYNPPHVMIGAPGGMTDFKWGLLILALVAIVGLIGLFAVLGTKDRK